MPRYDVAGRTVLITGSAGGLGTALADALRARGANLALLDLDANAVDTQAQALGGVTVARAWRADVRDFDSLQRATAEAAAHFGRIDVVIANAGIDTVASMAAIDPAAFDRVIDINLNGVWRTFRAAISHVQEHRGYLLAISSMAAFVHSPLQAPYAASKAGVWAMCDSIRLELRHLGVSVGSVHPTFFHTPMFDELVTDPAGRVLWGGNEKGLWKMVDRETVIADIVAASSDAPTSSSSPGSTRSLLARLASSGNSSIESAFPATPSRAPPSWPLPWAGTTLSRVSEP